MGNPLTVGVALAIPEPHAAVLAGWRHRIGDPEAGKIPPHVTLLPPTEIDADHFDVVDKHLLEAAATVLPFTMKLSGTGSFRPLSQVVFVQIVAGAAQCKLLEQAVRRDPIVRELEFPYYPHVTVGHDVADEHLDQAFEGLRDFVAQFRVEAFTLYAQNSDGSWRPHREYPLTGF
jgi:2'-5' RNA ligase